MRFPRPNRPPRASHTISGVFRKHGSSKLLVNLARPCLMHMALVRILSNKSALFSPSATPFLTQNASSDMSPLIRHRFSPNAIALRDCSLMRRFPKVRFWRTTRPLLRPSMNTLTLAFPRRHSLSRRKPILSLSHGGKRASLESCHGRDPINRRSDPGRGSTSLLQLSKWIGCR